MNDLKKQARRVMGGPVRRAWRTVRPHIPPRVAEGIRVPVKRTLRQAGLIG